MEAFETLVVANQRSEESNRPSVRYPRLIGLQSVAARVGDQDVVCTLEIIDYSSSHRGREKGPSCSLDLTASNARPFIRQAARSLTLALLEEASFTPFKLRERRIARWRQA